MGQSGFNLDFSSLFVCLTFVPIFCTYLNAALGCSAVVAAWACIGRWLRSVRFRPGQPQPPPPWPLRPPQPRTLQPQPPPRSRLLSGRAFCTWMTRAAGSGLNSTPRGSACVSSTLLGPLSSLQLPLQVFDVAGLEPATSQFRSWFTRNAREKCRPFFDKDLLSTLTADPAREM